MCRNLSDRCLPVHCPFLAPCRQICTHPCSMLAGNYSNTELVDRGLLVRLAGTQDRRRELGSVWGIRVVLRFQAEPLVASKAAVGVRSIEEVARVELNTRLSREDLQEPAAGRVVDASRQRQFSGLIPQHITMVIAGRVSQAPDRFASRWSSTAVKSNGVPRTPASSPVGINVSSTGRYWSAASIN